MDGRHEKPYLESISRYHHRMTRISMYGAIALESFGCYSALVTDVYLGGEIAPVAYRNMALGVNLALLFAALTHAVYDLASVFNPALALTYTQREVVNIVEIGLILIGLPFSNAWRDAALLLGSGRMEAAGVRLTTRGGVGASSTITIAILATAIGLHHGNLVRVRHCYGLGWLCIFSLTASEVLVYLADRRFDLMAIENDVYSDSSEALTKIAVVKVILLSAVSALLFGYHLHNERIDRLAFLRMRMLQTASAERHALERDLMAITFHEVRNPLNGTIGYLRLAHQKLLDADRVTRVDAGPSDAPRDTETPLDDVQNSITCTEQALQFLHTLSCIYGVESGKMEATRKHFDLCACLHMCATICKPQVQEGVKFELAVTPHTQELWVDSDETMLLQIVTNLVQNACRFTTKGHIKLLCDVRTPSADPEVGQPEPHALVDFLVQDTGSGLSEDIKNTLTDRYTSIGGLGLGMYLTNQLVQLLSSDSLQIKSPWSADGTTGSEFRFALRMRLLPQEAEARIAVQADARLAELTGADQQHKGGTVLSAEDISLSISRTPVQPAVPVVSPSISPAISPATPCTVQPALPAASSQSGELQPLPPALKVLLADDVAVNRKLLKNALSQLARSTDSSWDISEAATAEAAMEMARTETFDLIIIDEIFSNNPRALRGSGAIEQLREHERTTGQKAARIISCTGNGVTPDDRKELLKRGADTVWGKPIPDVRGGSMHRSLAVLLSPSPMAAP